MSRDAKSLPPPLTAIAGDAKAKKPKVAAAATLVTVESSSKGLAVMDEGVSSTSHLTPFSCIAVWAGTRCWGWNATVAEAKQTNGMTFKLCLRIVGVLYRCCQAKY